MILFIMADFGILSEYIICMDEARQVIQDTISEPRSILIAITLLGILLVVNGELWRRPLEL